MNFPVCSTIIALFQAELPPAVTNAGPLVVQARAYDMVTTSNPLTVVVELRNVSATQRIRIVSLEVELPGPLTLGFRQPLDTLIRPDTAVVLLPNRVTSLKTTYPATAFHKRPLSSLGYRCGDHQVNVRAVYQSYDSTEVPDSSLLLSSIVQVTVHPRAGIAAVIVGGIAGVLLASLLSLLHSRLQASKKPAEPPSSPAPRGSIEALTVLYGILVTTAAIYLLQATTVPGFPVSISLCDPLGGLILGLFFRPVSQFIQGKLAQGEQ
jgi:hypothetical protein